MANRTILGLLSDGASIGLRVSRPGSNVLNDNLPGKDVAFDTRWIGACRLVRSGNIRVNNGNSGTITYGATLPELPVVLALVTYLGSSITAYIPLGNRISSRTVLSSPDADGVNNALRPEADPAIDIRNDRVIFRNSSGSQDMRVHYIIMRR